MKTIKYLATIEFQYYGVRNDEESQKTQLLTIGVFEDKNEAHSEANKILERLEQHFKLNPKYNKRERFTSRSFNLISNLGYLETPFTFYVKIQQLNYLENLDDKIEEILIDIKKYKQLKEQQK